MKSIAVALFALCVNLVAAPAHAGPFVVDDIIVSDPKVSLVDPEFDLAGGRMTWEDLQGNLWVAAIDARTGALIPKDGRGTLVDTGLALISDTLNGPEWAFGGGQTLIAYTKVGGQGARYIAAAGQDEKGAWQAVVLPDGRNRWRPFGTPPSNTDPARINYLYQRPQGDKVLAWRDVDNSYSEQVFEGDTEGARWVEGLREFITTTVIDGVRQVVLINAVNGAATQLTFDPTSKFVPFMWFAPEYGELVFMAMVDTTSVGIFRNVGGQWKQVYNFTLPTAKPYFHSPEPFVYNGRSYILTVAAEQLSRVGNFIAQPVGPTEIWVAGIDPTNPFFRRVDEPTGNQTRLDPEFFIIESGPVIYYTEKNFQTDSFLLRRAATGLKDMPPAAAQGYDHPGYGGAWANMYRDNRNSSATPFDIPAAYSASGATAPANLQLSRPAIGPEGNLYYTFIGDGGSQQLAAYNTRTGAPAFSLGKDTTSGDIAVSSPLVDVLGDFYLAGNRFMAKYAASGKMLWKTDVRGFSRAAQGTSDNKLMFVTWDGWAYVLEPDSGKTLLEQNLVPWRAFNEDRSCLVTGVPADCAYIRAPALDPNTGVTYHTYMRDDGYSAVHAFAYRSSPRELVQLWRSEPLVGAATAPVLSADYRRIYVQDGEGYMVALDASTGQVVWRFGAGAASIHPPVVTRNGFIMPGGTEADGVGAVGIVRDQGASAAWAFHSSEYAPVSPAAAGSGDRFVLAARRSGGALSLIVVQPQQGVIGASPIAGAPQRFAGIALREDGAAFLTGWGGPGALGFLPVR